ncbi:MAG: hypothetical protein ACK4GM_00980 [Tabrizicola sp.]
MSRLPALFAACFLIAAAACPAQDCAGCGPGTSDWLEQELGRPFPEGVTLTGVLQGGFQDQFVQIRLSVAPEVLDEILQALGTSREALVPDPPLQREIVAADWWKLDDRQDVQGAEVTFGHFAHAAVFLAPEADGRLSLWLIAFEV